MYVNRTYPGLSATPLKRGWLTHYTDDQRYL